MNTNDKLAGDAGDAGVREQVALAIARVYYGEGTLHRLDAGGFHSTVSRRMYLAQADAAIAALARQPDEATLREAAKAMLDAQRVTEWDGSTCLTIGTLERVWVPFVSEKTLLMARAAAPLLTAPLAARVAEVEAKLAEAERERDEAQRLLATERERADNNIRASDRHRAEREALDWLLPCDAGYQRDTFEREEMLRQSLRPELVDELRRKWEELKASEARAALKEAR